MAKPPTMDGYSDQHTVDCERVLVTLLRRLGPWKESVFLFGGLTPRYLVPAKPPEMPAHAGTLDVDIVIDVQILTVTEAYSTLEDNLRRMAFEPVTNEKGQEFLWRWQTRTEHGAQMVVELLADAPEIAGGKVQPLPTEGTISALNIPHSSIVFNRHQVTEVQVALLDDAGIATEKIKHADLVSFTCLKAFAFDQRFEPKDAHDLVYCIEHAPEGLDGAAEMFRNALEGGHGAVIRDCLTNLRGRFAQDDKVEGHRKDGPVAVARFERGEHGETDQHEARTLRQREASDVMEQLLARIGDESE